jgi:hypothetical protein
MELGLAQSSGRFFPYGHGSSAGELVRDDVEAMELVCIKMEYVDDFEDPAL